jgi:ribonuclease T2
LRLGAALATSLLGAATPPALAGGTPGDFDFYVLSLSWSPTYCATDERPDPVQCRTPRGFVVHGLWPQYDGGGAPDSCPTAMPQFVPAQLLDTFADIFPTRGLAAHEWRTHGVCSGLPQSAYFSTIRRAWHAVTMPDDLRAPPASARTSSPRAIEAAFIAANPRMTETGIAVRCERGMLDEVRICLTKQLDFRRCPAVDRASCRDQTIRIPPQ